MRPQRVFAVVLRQLYLINGNLPRLMSLFVWCIVDIVLWGFMTHYLNGVNQSGYNFVPAILGAVLLWDFLIRVMHGLSMAFMEDSWSRNLLNVFASPITVGEYVMGLVCSSVMTSVLALIVMLVLATACFGLHLFAYGAMFVPFVLVLFLTGIALGIFATGMMLRYGPASEWLVWPIPAILSPFVGVFYPLSILPGWMQHVAAVLPPSYVFEGIRAIAAGHTPEPMQMVYGLGLSVVYIALAGLYFRRIYRQAVRTGLIARYSAETVS